ncbi:MAG: cation transporter [Bacteroidales bacterium]|nr:cation transporter [Bacteroidales bacterium]
MNRSTKKRLNGHPSLTRFAWLSISAALVTISLKGLAYLLTGSVGLLSDAMESFINLAGAIVVLIMLTIAARPADKDHSFGHNKAEYFSSGIEGILILVAAVGIAIAAINRLLDPKPLDQVGIGLAVSVLASLVNLFVALILKKAGKNYQSITLEADAKHLMTDVWTSAGVIVGVGLVALTGLQQLDPIVALIVAANIVWSGVNIMRKSVMGLMDVSLSEEKIQLINDVLEPYKQMGIQFHAFQTRQAGSREFISMHVLVPGKWTVQKGHQLIEKIESDIRIKFSGASVFTHLEPIEDKSSWDDLDLV